VKYLDDSTQSIGMLLAEAHRQLRAGSALQIEVRTEPLPSQLGAFLYLAQHIQVSLGAAISQRLEELSGEPRFEFDHSGDDQGLKLLERWLDQTIEAKENTANTGFWLSSFFLREREESFAIELTRLLVGDNHQSSPKVWQKNCPEISDRRHIGETGSDTSSTNTLDSRRVRHCLIFTDRRPASTYRWNSGKAVGLARLRCSPR
jgi:hypothetical protein